MEEKLFSEIRDGLIRQFRKLDKREGNLKEEIRVSDALANNAGKINATYKTEIAWLEHQALSKKDAK